MIVTLAGHVDHGKTSLVKALTGINTDSLAEERRRGLTIDIGFAYADIDGQRIGFVDVPGHHRFIHNMVAGVAAHQHALLVVAADDGPMPQTLEHLAILKLLGVTHGVAAVTKIDRVDAARVAEVEQAVTRLAEASGLHLSAVVATSSISGVGLDDLRRHITTAARRRVAQNDQLEFRLAVDRVFVIKGAGVVATGTVHSGVLNKGDALTIAPHGVSTHARTMRVSDQPSERADPGDRCAINLAGISPDQVARGDWLVAPTTLAPTSNVVINLTVLDDFPRPVKHWLPIHVYHAASHAEGHIALLDSTRLVAGESAVVELVLATPLHPKHGDRLVLRDHARERTIGGGSVIDIVAPEKARRAPMRIARLKIQCNDDPQFVLAQLLERDDVDIEMFRRSRNLTESAFTALLKAIDPISLQRNGRTVAVSRAAWSSALDGLTAQIAAYHKAAPHSQGLKADQIRRTGIVPKRWLDDALAALVTQRRISESGGHFHEPHHRPALPPDDAALLRRIESAIGVADQPPSIGDIGKSLAIPLRVLDGFIGKMTKLGLLVRVGDNRVLLPQHLAALSLTAQQLASAQPNGFSAREFRDAARIGRNLAVDVLEHFDHCGYTRRYGDLRRIVGETSTLRRT